MVHTQSQELVDSPFANWAGIELFGSDGHIRPLHEIEAEVIRLAVIQYRGRSSEIARHLDIGRTTLYRKLETLVP